MKRAILILCALCFCAPLASAQIGNAPKKTPPDPRVKAALDAIGYKYELTEDNDYRLTIENDQIEKVVNGKTTYRSQLAYVNSNTEKYSSLEIREVWSPAFYSSGPLSAAIANRLLRENNSVKFGAWRVDVDETSGKYLTIFAVQIAAGSDSESLRLAIKSVLLVADRMEKELTGKDDY